jgi:hypothetical protein
MIEARQLLAEKNPGAALLLAMKVQFLGMSFASKLLMFMNPTAAVVYDSVIARYLQAGSFGSLGWLANDPKSQNRRAQSGVYNNWCAYCIDTANEMNRHGSEWIDWDGSRQVWRAVDVERAVFALVGRDGAPESQITITA